MKKLLKVLIILGLVIVSLAMAGYTYYRFHQYLNFHAAADHSELQDQLNPQTKFVMTADNQRIAYWYFPVPKSKALVILVHGYDDPGGKAQMIGQVPYLRANGYSTALLDLRGYGESSGNHMTMGVTEWLDVNAVFDALRALPENQKQPTGLLGVSMGAVTSIVEAGVTGKPDFVIAAVPFKSIDSYFSHRLYMRNLPQEPLRALIDQYANWELGKDYQQFSAEAQIKNVTAPVLIISAAQDTVVYPQDATELYQMANEPKVYWQADSKHNVFYFDQANFEQHVLDFLKQYAVPRVPTSN